MGSLHSQSHNILPPAAVIVPVEVRKGKRKGNKKKMVLVEAEPA
jgi:hypothetical protein